MVVVVRAVGNHLCTAPLFLCILPSILHLANAYLFPYPSLVSSCCSQQVAYMKMTGVEGEEAKMDGQNGEGNRDKFLNLQRDSGEKEEEEVGNLL